MFELRSSLLVLSVGGLLLAVLASRGRRTASWSYTTLLFGAVIGLNALVHLALSVVFGLYMPGLITAVFLVLPVSVAALARGWRERWVAPGAYWTILPAAILVHGPVLAAFIRRNKSQYSERSLAALPNKRVRWRAQAGTEERHCTRVAGVVIAGARQSLAAADVALAA